MSYDIDGFHLLNYKAHIKLSDNYNQTASVVITLACAAIKI